MVNYYREAPRVPHGRVALAPDVLPIPSNQLPKASGRDCCEF